MSDHNSSASTRRGFLRGSAAAALAAGGAASQSHMSFAQSDIAPPSGNSGYVVVNVRDFGAVGNQLTDDTLAIQSAVDSIGTDGGIVYFPGGVYVITSAITVKSSTELLGESLKSVISAQTSDSAIKVAIANEFNGDIFVRRLNIRNDSSTPIGVDARYMSGCVIEDSSIDGFNQCGIFYGGNTNLTNASWSNTVVSSTIRNSPTCIYLNGEHSEGGSPANWITIERCLIIPTNTSDSIGIDLVNGDTARVIDNDISYASHATAIVIRRHFYAQLEYNRFEGIGGVAASHTIEKEYGYSNFQITGAGASIYQFTGERATIYYQRAEFLEFTGGPTGGTFTLTRNDAKTGSIDFSTDRDGHTLAENIRIALEKLANVGVGNVTVVPLGPTSMKIAWLNGRGKSNRPKLTANSKGLVGGTTPGILVVQGSTADAISQARDIALAGVVNDTKNPHLSALGEHLDIGIPVVTRMPILSVRPPGSSGVQFQRSTEDYPRLELSVDGSILWTNPDSGQSLGGLHLLSSDQNEIRIGWDDGLTVSLPRRLALEGETPVGDLFRGSLHRHEGEIGERDQLRVGIRDKDEATYFRHLYAGFSSAGGIDLPSIDSNGVTSVTLTATGAQVGDAVIVIPPADLASGLMATGFVSKTNTVTIRVMNGSGQESDPVTANWSILVLQL